MINQQKLKDEFIALINKTKPDELPDLVERYNSVAKSNQRINIENISSNETFIEINNLFNKLDADEQIYLSNKMLTALPKSNLIDIVFMLVNHERDNEIFFIELFNVMFDQKKDFDKFVDRFGDILDEHELLFLENFKNFKDKFVAYYTENTNNYFQKQMEEYIKKL